MRGRLPARPLGEIADAAMRVFTAKGFRPAGISDVAADLGLSHGAVYTYADSKQALLYLALLRALDPDGVDLLEAPVTAPAPDEIVERVRIWVGRQENSGSLAASLRDARQARPELSVEAELQAVVDALYGFIERNRTVLQLVARVSAELPELAQFYFVENRRAILARLGEFLSSRIDAGLLRPVPDVPVAARFIVETIAWFAMHRHGDPDSAMLSDEDCRRTVRDLVPSAFLPAGRTPRTEP
ncbi:TetR/AcrR family transcriptional regulator [Actinospica durhamensis]|uniref:TetR/AcrR family transcriptional regulator n=1 Tax=Actinospica durhamensis TaxID=1508375 RepID=A0A941IU76_9ACTN|nr:TetR/AcrR family transcriptional regulator [Actinospica durhamensis]MBR7835211.1 TetR/AcrR family transcriptional regulator [Actinospica durhamensis]